MLAKSSNFRKTYEFLCNRWDKKPVDLRSADYPARILRARTSRSLVNRVIMVDVAPAVGGVLPVYRVSLTGGGCEVLIGQLPDTTFRPSIGHQNAAVRQAAAEGVLDKVQLVIRGKEPSELVAPAKLMKYYKVSTVMHTFMVRREGVAGRREGLNRA